MKKIAIFASGTGSNFLAINDALNVNSNIAEVELLVSDKPNSLVVKHAQKLNKNVFTFTPKDFSRKIEYENIILSKLEEHEIDLIVLAGYMRIIGKTILSKYNKKIINIHPSLLPSFKGIDAIGQAIEHKVKVTGVTVHYVDEGVDTGEIIAQKSLDISSLNSREEIEKEIHKIEHLLYPNTIIKLLEE
ncbi:MAG: Phosphoribosylglycinamide formyltransferase [Candidatus Izimaplasma bacterium HR2]|nr:MAG: Phosphoribosylglycinamide formyltransferase [Candidatus Izimaplasma bacterium HR2]